MGISDLLPEMKYYCILITYENLIATNYHVNTIVIYYYNKSTTLILRKQCLEVKVAVVLFIIHQ